MERITRLTLLISIGFIYGCSIPTYENYVKQVTGTPIQRLLDIYDRDGIDLPPKYKSDNGNDVYIELAGPKCKIHWEVDNNKNIVGVYKTEGDCNF